MQLNRRPKLFPPLALAAPAAGSFSHAGARQGAASAGRSSLSPMEFRRIVADMLG
jgi:hypothetical protein